MFEKIKEYALNLLGTAKGKINTMQKPIKFVVIGYFVLVVILILTYYVAWLYLWQGGKASLPDLLAIIKEMVGPAMIAFVSFIGGCFVDLNNNGVPDQLENNNKNCGMRR